VNDKPVAIDPAKTKMVQELKHTAPLLGCRVDPSGRFVFAGAQEAILSRWELDGGKRTPLAGHKSWVRAIAFSGATVFSADYSGKVIAWPIEGDKPAPRWMVSAHKGFARALAVSPDGKTLASCGNDHLVRLWSTADGKEQASYEGHESHVYNVLFHPDGKSLVSGDLKGVVKQWDLATGKVTRTFDAAVLHKYDPSFMADHGGIRGIAFSGDGKLLACAGISEVQNAFAGVGKPLVVLFDWESGKQKMLLKPKDAFQGTMWGVAFHPSGWVIGVGGGNGGMLWFWKPTDTPSAHAIKLPTNARDLSLHPDGKRVAIAFFDGAVRLYEMPAVTEVRRFWRKRSADAH
jgi:WD40 repeat protein